MNLRAELEALIKQARADLAYFERVQVDCAAYAATLPLAKIAAQKVEGKVETKARAMKLIERLKSDLTSAANAAAAAHVRTTAALLALQAELDKLPEGESC
jgi:hypothetical protein